MKKTFFSSLKIVALKDGYIDNCIFGIIITSNVLDSSEHFFLKQFNFSV